MSFKVKSKGEEFLDVLEFCSFSRFPSQVTAFHFFYRTKQKHVHTKFYTFFIITVEMGNTVLLVNMVEGAGVSILVRYIRKYLELDYILFNEDLMKVIKFTFNRIILKLVLMS